MKYIYIILIVAVVVVLGVTVIFTRFNIIKENSMVENNFYTTEDPFFYQTYNGKTYGQIANIIIGELAGLKKDFPELTGIYDNPVYNLTKGSENFYFVFEYKNPGSTDGGWYLEGKKYERPLLPEGKTPLPLEMMADYDFIGKIGDMLALVNFREKNDRVKNRIIEILKDNGAVQQGKEIFLQMPE